MDRRRSLKALFVGTVSTSVLIDACKPGTDKKTDATVSSETKNAFDDTDLRQPDEIKKIDDEMKEKFYTDHEMATIVVLGDIIIPKDEVSGSASDAKVADFIEFITKDQPENKVPMRGGLRWLDMQCLNRYNNPFKDSTSSQQIEMVDEIAYPAKAKPEMKQGVAFFNLMRDLVVTGFYTSEIGVKDVGYAGNSPNQWNGVPDDVLKQYGLAYTDKELKECVSF